MSYTNEIATCMCSVLWRHVTIAHMFSSVCSSHEVVIIILTAGDVLSTLYLGIVGSEIIHSGYLLFGQWKRRP